MKIYKTSYDYNIHSIKPYYIDGNGEIHYVRGTHLNQIIDDYGLASEIYENIGDWEDLGPAYGETMDYIDQFSLNNNIYCFLVDRNKKEIKVRNSMGTSISNSKGLSPVQKRELKNFAIENGIEQITGPRSKDLILL